MQRSALSASCLPWEITTTRFLTLTAPPFVYCTTAASARAPCLAGGVGQLFIQASPRETAGPTRNGSQSTRNLFDSTMVILILYTLMRAENTRRQTSPSFLTVSF